MLVALLACVLACVAACNDGNIGDAFGADQADDPDGGGADGGVADAALPDAPACTDGDRQSVDGASGTCYFALLTARSYLQGRADCQTAGGDLVRVDSSVENDLVFALANTPAPVAADWWLGGNDLVTEGKFVWLDDVTEIVAPLFEQWRTGEPNNAGTNGEDCMILESDNPLKEWDDRPCGNTFPVICERAP